MAEGGESGPRGKGLAEDAIETPTWGLQYFQFQFQVSRNRKTHPHPNTFLLGVTT